VTLADTGANTMTGARLKRVGDYIGDETFCMTCGDGVGNVDVRNVMTGGRETDATVDQS
jgi:glucose-1-phosphate cytidylyltransferase